MGGNDMTEEAEKYLPEVAADQEKGAVMVRPSIFLDMRRFEDAQRVGNLLASSSLVPEHFRKNVANCVIALNLADRLRVDPFMMMQNMYVVHGRPGIEGKMAIALIEGTGRFSPLKFKFEGQGKTDKGVPRADSCVAYATELKTGEVVEGPPVTWTMAVTEGWTKDKGQGQLSKWQTLPDLMFRYRAAMFFARVNCPGALLGLRSVDELEDIGAIPMEQVSPGRFEPAFKPEPQEVPTADVEAQFAEEARKRKVDPETLEAFLLRAAKMNKSTVEEVKAEALKRSDAFWKAYGAFAAQEAAADNKKKGNNGKAAAKNEPAEKKDEPAKEAKQPDYITCPDNDSRIDPAHCDKCKKREGCPAWPQE